MGKNLSTMSIIGNCPTLVNISDPFNFMVTYGDINGNKITLLLNEAKVPTIGFKIQIVK